MSGRSIIIALLLGAAVALLIWLPGERGGAPEQAGAEDAPSAGPPPQAESRTDSPAAAVYRPSGFREDVRAFLDEAAGMSAQDRRDRAEALRARILEREAQGLLMPGESAYLQLALLRVVVDDAEVLRERSETLLAEYQEKLEAGWDEYRRKPDIRHEAYRAAEAELVRRAVTEGPGAMPQDELRRQLRELRAQYYDEPLQ